MKVQRSNAIPENEMAIIPDMDTLIHNIVTSELKDKDKEIARLNNELKRYEEEIRNILQCDEWSDEYIDKYIKELKKEGKNKC